MLPWLGTELVRMTAPPIVFPVASDPVGGGLVASLARPGGNVTGLSLQFTDLAGKRLELLRELVPGLGRLEIMANAGASGAMLEMGEIKAMARALGLEVATAGLPSKFRTSPKTAVKFVRRVSFRFAPRRRAHSKLVSAPA
jgi:ABC-type uncharacterized transport system substrate-binding protein